MHLMHSAVITGCFLPFKHCGQHFPMLGRLSLRPLLLTLNYFLPRLLQMPYQAIIPLYSNGTWERRCNTMTRSDGTLSGSQPRPRGIASCRKHFITVNFSRWPIWKYRTSVIPKLPILMTCNSPNWMHSYVVQTQLEYWNSLRCNSWR